MEKMWNVYLIHHSHTDIGYTERQEKIMRYHYDFIRQAIDRFGAEHIVVGIDAKDGYVAVEGWEKLSDKTAVNMALA